ncbi:MAG: NADH-quinone oxidoreductase subunit C [Candidatus Eisenbacteria bacterium]|nr:NADH-quinone oxidoreductase subunit C [Candidatus Eisenbacteria bacterium]
MSMLEILRSKFGEGVEELADFVGHKTFLVPPRIVREVSSFLRNEQVFGFDYLTCLSGIDRGKEEPRFEVSYLLSSLTRREMIQLKVRVNDGEAVPSVCDIWRTADWHEREAFDLLGIVFSGHPNLKRILLPEGWTGHPLRKDYVVAEADKEPWEREESARESNEHGK